MSGNSGLEGYQDVRVYTKIIFLYFSGALGAIGLEELFRRYFFLFCKILIKVPLRF